jgi:RimJ/RimL family protein N-acetyltransferase
MAERRKKAQKRGQWLRTVWHRVATTFCRRMLVGARELDRPIPNLQSSLPDARMAPLDPRDVAAYHSFRPDQSERNVRARLDAGHRCWVTWLGSEIIDANWTAAGRVPVPYLGYDVLLDDGDVLIYDSFTAPAWRRRGLYMAKSAYVLYQCRALGFRRIVAMIAVENKAPIAVTARLGLVPLGIYTLLRVGPFRTLRIRSLGSELPPRMVR